MNNSKPSSFQTKVDIAQLDSNSPGEDRFQILKYNNFDAYCVIDGHGGYLAADITLKLLLTTIYNNVQLLQIKTSEEITQAIDNAFVSIDEHILQEAILLSSQDSPLVSPRLLGEIEPSSTAATLIPTNTTTSKSTTTTDIATNETKVIIHTPPPKPKGLAGCCVVAVIIIDSILYIAHVG